ncbi:MAG: thiamine pyrophosphate-dependent enzyme [Ilumatobacteraceae bacterium]
MTRTVPPSPVATEVDAIAGALQGKRGVVVAGAGCEASPGVLELARVLSWPVLADPRSGCRVTESASPVVVAAADVMLRNEGFAKSHCPDVIIRIGEPPISKVMNQWLQAAGAFYVSLATTPRLIDPDRVVTHHVVGSISQWCAALIAHLQQSAPQSPGDAEWLASWKSAESVAQRMISESLSHETSITEPAIARALSKHIPHGSRLVVSSSMPVRDLEWFAEPRDGLPVYSNRGASGIDGVVSTAVGVALASHAPTYLLIGDIAMLHDSNGLIGLAQRKADVRIVCVDNRGGGIFSFLPQASALNATRFEQLFGTPHESNIELIAQAHGIARQSVKSIADFINQVDVDGSWLMCIATNRAENVAVHERLNASVGRVLAP